MPNILDPNNTQNTGSTEQQLQFWSPVRDRTAYNFNGQSYMTLAQAEQARANYMAAAQADYASVGYDMDRYNRLVNSGYGLVSMTDDERNYISNKFLHSPDASMAYKNNETDAYLASVGLPPMSKLDNYRNAYTKYTSSGNFKDNFGNVSQDDWDVINRLWKSDWKYSASDEDTVRKLKGLAPVEYDSMYGDTLLDTELKERGLPPTKLLTGKLGEKYSSYMTGGIKDVFSDVSNEQWNGIKDYWKNQWVYANTDEDQMRKKLGEPPKAYDSQYTDTQIDDDLKKNGLPPLKLLTGKLGEKYAEYEQYGGVEDAYADTTPEVWNAIKKYWSREWVYTNSAEDQNRRAAGMPPASYDSKYEDTRLDQELKAAGLPPQKMLSGTLGEKFNEYVSNGESYNNFMYEAAQRYIASDGNTNANDIIAEMLADPKYAEFGGEHVKVYANAPEESDSKYAVKDEFGNVINGEYDAGKWIEDNVEAAKKNSKIAADEFAITPEKVEEYIGTYGPTIRADNAAREYFESNDFAGIGKFVVEHKGTNAFANLLYNRRLEDIFQGQNVNDGEGITLDMLFDDANTFTPEERKKLEPIVAEINARASTKGLSAAQEYITGGEMSHALHEIQNDAIEASYRETYASDEFDGYNVPGSNNYHSREQILRQHYTEIGKPFGMTDDEITQLMNGDLTMDQYINSKVTSVEDGQKLGHKLHQMQLEKQGLPTEKYELENEKAKEQQPYEKSYIPQTGQAVPADQMPSPVPGEDTSNTLQGEMEYWIENVKPRVDAMTNEIKTYDAMETHYFLETMQYTADFKEKTKDDDAVDQMFKAYFPAACANAEESSWYAGDVENMLDAATWDEERKFVYLCDVYGADSAEVRNYAADVLAPAIDVRAKAYRATDKYKWFWKDKTDSKFLQWAGGAANYITNIIGSAAEGVYNFGSDTFHVLSGKRIASSNRLTVFSDTQANINEHVREGWSGDVGAFLVGSAPSAIKCLTYGALAKATGGVSAPFTLALMGMESYSNGVDQALQNGASSEQAWMYGLACGLNEIIFEKISLDHFLEGAPELGESLMDAFKKGSTRKEAAKLFWKQLGRSFYTHAPVEASEEIFTGTANFFAEQLLLGYNSSYNKTYQHYIDGGLDPDKASDLATWGVVKDLAIDGLGGFLTGAILSGGNNVSTYFGKVDSSNPNSPSYRVLFDNTGLTAFVNATHNLSMISYNNAISFANDNVAYDANGNITLESATKIVDELIARGADALTLQRVTTDMMKGHGVQADVTTMFDTRINDQRDADKEKLVKAASEYAYSKATTKGKKSDVMKAEIANVTRQYVDELANAVLPSDRVAIAAAVRDMQNNYIANIEYTVNGTKQNIDAGEQTIQSYFNSLNADEKAAIQKDAETFKNSFAKAGMTNADSGRYAVKAATLVHATENADTMSALTTVFGDQASVSPTAVRNACLNEDSNAARRYVDNVCAALATLDTMDNSHMFKATQNGANATAYVASQMALARSLPTDSLARSVYEHISKHGAYSEALDLLTASTTAQSMGGFEERIRKTTGKFRTRAEIATITDAYNKAERNYRDKLKIAEAHRQADAQALSAEDGRITMYDTQIATLNAMIENETDMDVHKKLLDSLADNTSARQKAVDARNNLVAEQNKRMASTEADVSSAKQAYNNAKQAYYTAIRENAIKYVERFGAQLESMKAGANVSRAELARMTALVNYGTTENLNDVNERIIATEKAASVALGNALGVEVEFVAFTEEFFNEKKVPKNERDTKARACEIGGKIYINDGVDPETNERYIKPLVGSLTDYVMLHEIGHVLELSTDNYDKFAKFARQYFEKQDGKENVKNWVAKHGEKELVAEFARKVALADPRAVSALCKAAPKMSMRVFQWLTKTKSRMSSAANAQTKLVTDAQRAFANGLKAIHKGDIDIKTESTNADTPAMENALKVLEESYRTSSAATKAEAPAAEHADARERVSDENTAAYYTQYDITKPFENQVEDFINGKTTYNNAILMGSTTEHLRGIGASNIPMLFSPGHLAYNTRKATYQKNPNMVEDHIFVDVNDTPKEKARKIKAIRDAIYDPVAIITSRTQPNDSVVMILDVDSINGKKATAAVIVDGIADVNRKTIDGHVVRSVSGRNNTISPANANGVGLLEQAFKDEANNIASVLYWNEKKVNDLAKNHGLKLPRAMPISPYVHNIHDSDVSVKPALDDVTESEQFRRWSHEKDVDYYYDERLDKWYYVNDNGQMKSVDNIGTFDEDIQNAEYYTEYDPDTFNAEEHDAEYMELAKKYRAGTATHEDVVKLRSLVNAQALHQGVMGGDFDEPLDLYHGTPDFGFTEFDPTRPWSNGNLYTSTDPAVSNGYAGVAEKESDAPLTREVSSALDPRLRDEYLDNLSANGLARRANAIIPGAKISVSFTRGNYTTEDEFTDEVTGKKYDRELLYHDMRYSALDAMSEDELLRYAAQVLPNKLIVKSNDPNFEYQDANNSGEPMNREDIIEYLIDEMGKGIYHLYGFAGDNQYRTDADEANWESIYDEMGVTTDDIAENARNSGFTSTRIDNVIDPSGDYPGADNVADDVIFYEPWQMKSADLVTVDDDGDIIPLSQRFDKTNSDIRYYTEYDPQTEAAADSIDNLTDEQRTWFGDPKLIQTDGGFVVARKVSREGLITGNPMFNTGKVNMAMIAPTSAFTNGDVGRTVQTAECSVVVIPSGDEYAEERADAREAGTSVYMYDASDPTQFDRAIERAANMSRIEYYPNERYEDFLEKYGAIEKKAEPRVSGREVPRQTTDTNRVSEMAANAASAPVTTEDTFEHGIKSWIEAGTGTYTPVSNAKTLDRARGQIAREGSLKQAVAALNSDVANSNGKATDLLARAELLYVEAQKSDNDLTDIEREQIFGNLCIIASDAGRALQLASQLKNMTAEGHINYIEQVGKRMADRYEKRTKKPINLKLTEEEKEAYRTAMSEEQRKEIDAEVGKRFSDATSELTFMDRVRNWRYFSMLGNARTHFRNIVGNSMMIPITRSKDAVNAGLQRAFGIDQADRTSAAWTGRVDDATREFVNEQLKAALPIMQGVSEKYIENAEKSTDKSETGLRSLWKDVASAAITKGRTWLGRGLNKLSSFNTNALEAEDAKFLGLRFRSVMYQMIKARGIDIENVTAEQKESMVNHAMGEALIATFRDASAIADALNRFANTNKATRFLMEAVVPFKRTPINIAKRSIEYSPLGVIDGLYKLFSNKSSYNKNLTRLDAMTDITDAERADRKSGYDETYKQQKIKAIDRLAEGVTGSVLYGIGIFASLMGWVTIGRKDDEKSKFENALGKNTYSLNIGDFSIDLSAFSPAAVPLLMGVATRQAFGAERDDGFFSGMIQTLCESVDPITEMSMLSGIADALSGVGNQYEDGSNTRWFGTIAGNAVESMAGQFVPTLVGQFNRTFDPYTRSYTAGDEYWATRVFDSDFGSSVKSIQNKVFPWLSEPKVNLHGEEQRNYTNVGAWVMNAANNLILPATIRVDQKNDIDYELVRLYGTVGDADIFPTKPSRNLGAVGSEQIKLTNDTEYAQYQKEYGQTVYDLLEDLMQSQSYARMTDAQRAEAIERVIDQAKSATRKRWKAQKTAN